MLDPKQIEGLPQHPTTARIAELIAELSDLAATDTDNICVIAMSATILPGTKVADENIFGVAISGQSNHMLSTLLVNMERSEGLAAVMIQAALEFIEEKENAFSIQAAHEFIPVVQKPGEA